MASPMSAQERARREEAVRYALVSLRLEGLYLDEEELAIYQQYVRGEMCEDDLNAALDARQERRFGPLPLPEDRDA